MGQRDLPSGVISGVFILNAIFLKQPPGVYIQVFGQSVGLHTGLERRCQLRGASAPRLRYQLCHGFQNRVRRFFVKLVFHALQFPNLCFRVFFR